MIKKPLAKYKPFKNRRHTPKLKESEAFRFSCENILLKLHHSAFVFKKPEWHFIIIKNHY